MHKKIKSFQGKLIVLFLISIIIPITLLAATLTSFFQKKLMEDRLQFSTNTLYSVANTISNYADDLQRLALSPHIYDNIMKFYTSVENNAYVEKSNTPEINILRNDYITTLQRLLITARKDIISISFMPVDPNQQLLLLTTKHHELKEVTNYNYHDEYWFQEALKKDGSIIYTATDKLPYHNKETTVFSAVHKIRNVYSKKDIGVIRIDASDKLITNIFSHISTTPSSTFLLVDENGKVIYSTANITNDVVDKIFTDTTCIESNKNTWDLYQQPIDNLPWRVVYMSSRQDINADICTIWLIALCISLSVILISYYLFKVNSKSITQSLDIIIQAFSRIKKGNLNTPICTNLLANEEFLLIANHLNSMMEQLEKYIENEYSSEIFRQQAEYRALQSQVNPHFLYNTLNNFVALNRLGRTQELEDSIIYLTKMFRYTCSNAEYTTIADELDFCTQYIHLLRMRYDNQITLKITYSEEASTILIPRLLLQPLVENAIKHGMEPTGNPIIIWITVGIKNQILYITIKNNGLPIDMNQLRNCECVGINNIKSRIEIFHNDASFEIGLVEDNITSIAITIPLSKNNDCRKEASNNVDFTSR